MALISVTEYGKKYGMDGGRIRHIILEGRLPAQKIGNQWVIDSETPPPADKRIRSGKYIKEKKETAD